MEYYLQWVDKNLEVCDEVALDLDSYPAVVCVDVALVCQKPRWVPVFPAAAILRKGGNGVSSGGGGGGGEWGVCDSQGSRRRFSALDVT